MNWKKNIYDEFPPMIVTQHYHMFEDHFPTQDPNRPWFNDAQCVFDDWFTLTQSCRTENPTAYALDSLSNLNLTTRRPKIKLTRVLTRRGLII